MRDAGWRLVDRYVWSKSNPVPGAWNERLRDGFEDLYHFALGETRIKFRSARVKVPDA